MENTIKELHELKISTIIILFHLHLTKLDCHYFKVLWENFNGNILYNYITPVFPGVLHTLLCKFISGTKLEQDYQRWRKRQRLWEQLVHKVSEKDVINGIKI